MTASGWVFLIGRGRELGYRLLMAPDFLVHSGESGQLLGVVRSEDETVRPAVARLDDLCVAYHVRGIRGPDGSPALDGSGRPLVVGFGFVARGGAIIDLDERDLDHAWEVARSTYQRFSDDELNFAGVPTTPFPLRSTIAPPEPAGKPRATQPRPPARPSILTVGVLGAAVVLASGMVLTQCSPDVRTRIEVPSLVGMTITDAQDDLRDAGLAPALKPLSGTGCEGNLVLDQTPEDGVEVDASTTVTLTICAPSGSRAR
ncbi:PASTA domain-containing protein [Cryptosporangium sp. NPDC051539]|uniref:PASTA domain-containing protein n=1 Tax=Cryptosporangium sp. NPDC051539 TaxID=3363962 RepID=UPI00379ECA2D